MATKAASTSASRRSTRAPNGTQPWLHQHGEQVQEFGTVDRKSVV